MKTKSFLVSLVIGFGLLTQALTAQGGPNGDRGYGRVQNPDECPLIVDGECPGCAAFSPEECPYALDGTCPNLQFGANGEQPRDGQRNPTGEPKRDGSGGPGKPENPDGPQDGTAPGQGYRGGRG